MVHLGVYPALKTRNTVYAILVDSTIIVFTSLILIELICGTIIGFTPPPISMATITMMENDPRYSIVEQGKSWLQVAQETNDSFFATKSITQFFLIVIAPIATTVGLVRTQL